MRKTVIAAIGASLALLMVGNTASAETTTAKAEGVANPDMLGLGHAAETHSADLTGAVSVSASADESLITGMYVPGTAIGLGASSANSSGRLIQDHMFTAGPGTWKVTVQITGINASATGSITPPSLPMRPDLLQSAEAWVASGLKVTLRACQDVFCPVTQVAEKTKYVAHTAGQITFSSVTLEVTVSTLTTDPVFLTVDTGLYAGALVRGAGTAASSATGTISSITVQQV